ncbi:Crp/Fnr family transcriptional regulator [Saccharopolyspora griseoalba]|uniref:Crp/Fnr family transcriptional regulator n=1 Tax=Saccharopolyspora griseoalba TaxID=1431848 RepID=A0ABW2LR51_9PSEU
MSPRGFRGFLGERRWRALEGRGALRICRPGEYLLRQGAEGGSLFALISGRVKVLAGDRDGAEVLLSLRGPGDLVGEMAARRRATRSATVQTLEKCTIRSLSRPEFDRFLEEEEAQDAFTDYLVAKLSETVPYQVQQVHFSPRRKLARLLLEVVRLAEADSPDCYRIPFSQRSLAHALGMVRSTVAEQIRGMRADGVLGPGPRIEIADLRALAEDAGAVSDQ